MHLLTPKERVMAVLNRRIPDRAPWISIKAKYGQKLAFHGAISTAGPLAYGTPQDVEMNVRETLEIMMPGGGMVKYYAN